MLYIIYVFGLVTSVLARPDVAFLNKGYQYNQEQNQNEFLKKSMPVMQQELPSSQRSNNFFSSFNGQHEATDIQPQLVMEPPRQNYENLAPSQMTQDSYQEAYQYSGIPHESGYASSAPRTQVYKHVYVHMPPKDFEEEDAVQPHVYHQSAPKQKHYKIVFIKSPEIPAARPAIVAPPPANEEKTVIYVLHKKPDTHQDIVIPAPPPTAPSKPEVFFIKYKTKKEGAPVYGVPPLAAGSDPRHSGAPPSASYIPPTAAVPEDISQEMTTMMSVVADSQVSQKLSDAYLPPTMSSNDQTLPTSKTKIYPTVKDVPKAREAQLPVARYGPPNHFFFKH